MTEQDSQFRKEVQKAKAKYSRTRKYIILSIMTFALVFTLIQTYIYINEKKEVTSQLATQNQEIEKLDKENKVNEVVIDKLKDPYFISDLVRQEYGLSYEGETIFNLPNQENFLESTIKSIMDSNAEKAEDNHGRIDDSKIPELNKKDDDKTSTSNDKDSNNNDDDDEDSSTKTQKNQTTTTTTTQQTSQTNTNNTKRSNRG